MKSYPLLFWLPLLLIAGCKGPTDPPEPVAHTQLVLEFVAVADDQPFVLGETYRNPADQPYTFERFRFLASDLRLVNANGGEDTLVRSALIDLGEKTFRTADTLIEGSTTMTFDIPPGEYRGLRLGLGVPASRNNGNPADYPASHPLSVRHGMHWTWSSGYIFAQLDGRIDTTGQNQGNFDLPFVYHPGTNELYRDLAFLDQPFQALEDETSLFTIEVDVNRAFYSPQDSIDMQVNNFTHSTPVGSDAFRLAERVIDNLAAEAFRQN